MKLNLFKKIAISISLITSSIFGISLLSSAKPLKTLSPVMGEVLTPLVQSEKRLQIDCEWMTGEESKRVFGHDFPSRKIEALKVSIQNNTGDSYALSSGSVDLPRLTASQVAGKIRKSALPRSIAFRIAGFFFWPISIPGTIDSIRVWKHNYNLKKEINTKSLKDQEGETITPYSSVSRVLFVPKDAKKSNIDLTLIDIDTLYDYKFNVDVKEKE